MRDRPCLRSTLAQPPVPPLSYMASLSPEASEGRRTGVLCLLKRVDSVTASIRMLSAASGSARMESLGTQAPQVVHCPVAAQLCPNRVVPRASVIPRAKPCTFHRSCRVTPLRRWNMAHLPRTCQIEVGCGV